MSPPKQSLIERAAASLGGEGRLETFGRLDGDGAVEDAAWRGSEAEPKIEPFEHELPGHPAPTIEAQRSHAEATRAGPAARRPSVEIDFDRLETHRFIRPDKLTTRLAEELRLIKRALLLRAQDSRKTKDRHNVIMVTSAKPREGKTFTSINLAISMATEQDMQVLLIDADVVRPAVMKSLGLEASAGLTDLLGDPNVDPSDVMLRTNINKLSLLPAGSFNSRATELLSSDRMRNFVEELGSRYPDRMIIFDSPPVLATSEPAALSEHVDQIVFVVEAGKTSQGAIRSALEVLDDDEKVLMILNKISPIAGTPYFGSYYGYYGKDRK